MGEAWTVGVAVRFAVAKTRSCALEQPDPLTQARLAQPLNAKSLVNWQNVYTFFGRKSQLHCVVFT